MILDTILRYLRERQVAGFVGSGIVLDAGCGRDAHFLHSIKHKIKIGFGADKKSQNITIGNIKLFSLDLENDEFPEEWNSFFDQVFMLASLEHLNWSEAVLKKIYRALKPGGEIYITSPSPWARPILNVLARLRLIDAEEIHDHKHYFSKKEQSYIIENAGFKDIKHKYFELCFNQFILARKL